MHSARGLLQCGCAPQVVAERALGTHTSGDAEAMGRTHAPTWLSRASGEQTCPYTYSLLSCLLSRNCELADWVCDLGRDCVHILHGRCAIG